MSRQHKKKIFTIYCTNLPVIVISEVRNIPHITRLIIFNKINKKEKFKIGNSL